MDAAELACATAARGDGSSDVAPDIAIVSRGGRAIGSVRSVATDAKGRVKSVLVSVGDRTASIPASNFTGSGSVLVSAMGRGDFILRRTKVKTAPPILPTNNKFETVSIPPACEAHKFCGRVLFVPS